MLIVGAGVLVSSAHGSRWRDLRCGRSPSCSASPRRFRRRRRMTAPDRSHSLATRVGDLDDVLPILLGGLVLASMHQGFSAAALWLAAQSGLIALVIAARRLAAGRTGALPKSEQHVFVAGTLLLLGGTAAYLSMSALWVGLLGGIFWSLAGGPARDSIERDMRYLQHPLIVLLLLVAGAQLQPSVGARSASSPSTWLAGAQESWRAAGSLGRAVVRDLPSDLWPPAHRPWRDCRRVRRRMSCKPARTPRRPRCCSPSPPSDRSASELLSVIGYPQRGLP